VARTQIQAVPMGVHVEVVKMHPTRHHLPQLCQLLPSPSLLVQSENGWTRFTSTLTNQPHLTGAALSHHT
jgi:hypothetical protein